MRSRTSCPGLAAALLLAGCATFEMPAPPLDHPAHPDAATAPRAPVSRTLAYGPADVPSVRPIGSAAAAGGAASDQPGATHTVVGEGEVVATVPNAGQLVLEHGEIPGFMEAMTMGYRIDPPSLLEGLKPGDGIRFTIDVHRRAITAIEKLR